MTEIFDPRYPIIYNAPVENAQDIKNTIPDLHLGLYQSLFVGGIILAAVVGIVIKRMNPEHEPKKPVLVILLLILILAPSASIFGLTKCITESSVTSDKFTTRTQELISEWSTQRYGVELKPETVDYDRFREEINPITVTATDNTNYGLSCHNSRCVLVDITTDTELPRTNGAQ